MYAPHSMTWYEAVKSGTLTSWRRNTVKPVMWQANEIAIADLQGVSSRDSVTVYVPLLTGTFAFKKGDVLVKGEVSDVIGTGFTISALLAKYSSAVKITRADFKDYGSVGMRHWELRGGV